MRLLIKFLLATVVFWVGMVTDAMAYEEVEDLVDIFATEDRFIAVVDSRRNFSEPFRTRETILWQGARGEVGAFLTSKRLLAVSVNSGQWNSQFLKIKEKNSTPHMLLGAHLVVMLSGERIVGFGTRTGGFFQKRMPIGESIVESDIRGRVAAVITPKRAFALSANRRGVAEIRFRIPERFESIKTTYNKLTLRTSQRLLTFAADKAVWREIELD
jgi:hypothetical protein